MKTIPFPLSVNIGTDIVCIPRIKQLLTRPPKSPNPQLASMADRFIRRIMNKQETQHFYSKFGYSDARLPSHFSTMPRSFLSPEDAHTLHRIALWIGGRFAAKEAARKAAPGGAASLSWRDVIVQTEGEGGGVAAQRPEVLYLQDGEGVSQAGKLSISHDGDYVVATVLAAASASEPSQGDTDAGVGSDRRQSRQYRFRAVGIDSTARARSQSYAFRPARGLPRVGVGSGQHASSRVRAVSSSKASSEQSPFRRILTR